MAIDTQTQAASAWLTTGQAARRLTRSTQWVRTLVDRGTLRAERTPYGRMIDPASVETFIRAREMAGSTAILKPA